MGFISFSRTRKFKALFYSLVGVGSLFLVIGILLLVTNKPNIPAQSLEIQASGIVLESTGWRLDVYQKDTTIRVTTEPGNQTRTPITFVIEPGGDTYLNISSQIQSGELAVISLRTDISTNSFFYGREVSILANCGMLSETLTVRICIPETEIKFNKKLMYNNGTTWIDASEQKLSVNNYEYNNMTRISNYRLDVNFTIFGYPIPGMSFSITPANEESSEITILPGGYIDVPSYYLRTRGEYKFEIKCTYNNKQYLDYFTLKIV